MSMEPSPTSSSFSNISNYPVGDTNVPTVPPNDPDYRLASKTHFSELDSYLAACLAKAPPKSRSTARQKLTPLTIEQFHELSTDVYDELIRRKCQDKAPFLPFEDGLHPKRNQARQKLSVLSTSRFEDLCSDIHYELARKYPEFKEEESHQAPPPDLTNQHKTLTRSLSNSTNGAPSSTAASETVSWNKRTDTVEDIEVPYSFSCFCAIRC